MAVFSPIRSRRGALHQHVRFGVLFDVSSVERIQPRQ